MMLAESAWQVVAASAPWSFLVGTAVGFVASNHWKIVRRNGGSA